jgi:Asp-tRNA(Asn)/Glu-tRNA(Gln) amidotransferase B subunit
MNQLASIDPLPENAPALVTVIKARERIPRERLTASLASSATTLIDAEEVLAETVLADAAELGPLVDRILDASPAQVASYRGGKQGVLGFFVGQVMKETQGKADPKIVNELLRRKLDG